jgi:uncharacterized protein YecE (DUF72 family)
MELLSDGPFDLDELRTLREQIPPLIHLGTSSWNYPEGWRGLVYHRKYPKSVNVAKLLAEYVEFPLFDTVGIDAAFYRPLGPATYRAYREVLPVGFRCVQKVWNRVTVHTFTGHQDGGVAGRRNPDFLNAELCVNEVIGPALEHFAGHVGPFVFEFQAIARSEGLDPNAFAERLDAFLGQLPADASVAVEVRNAGFLAPPYFATLREHGAAHALSSWTRMPPIGEQLDLPDSVTGPFLLTRALNRPGRTFEEAVSAFAPYDRIQDENPELRRDLCRAAERALRLRIPIYLLVGNRAEGSSPHTIAAVARMLAQCLS